jgi:flagellar biosynthesis/type III secretory pathway protein FliH
VLQKKKLKIKEDRRKKTGRKERRKEGRKEERGRKEGKKEGRKKGRKEGRKEKGKKEFVECGSKEKIARMTSLSRLERKVTT